MTAIDIKNLTKCFGDTLAVDDLTLSIEEGELFALLGVNGAGKTTTIRMLTGLLPPDSGEMRLLGKSVSEAKAFTAVSPQESAVAPNLTVSENMLLMTGIYGMEKTAARERCRKVMEALGLDEVAKKKAKTLSGGWQRRLSIAMALISGPEILFMDEPTLGLDVLARRELWEMIRKLRGRVTILMTTHYLEEAEALSDCIAIMRSGRLVSAGTARELTALAGKDNFEDAFVALSTMQGRE